MTAVELVDTDTFAASIVTAAQIYGEAMRRPPELVVQRREIMSSHVVRPGFVGVLAHVDDDLVAPRSSAQHGRDVRLSQNAEAIAETGD